MSDEENPATGETPGKMEESTRTGIAFFDKLPAEIRDEIYYLAYVAPGDQVVKITSMKEIVQRERHRRRNPYSRASQFQLGQKSSSLATGTCPLYQMMVSRQFFQEASTKWLRSVTIKGENTYLTEFTKYCAQSQALQSALTSVDTVLPVGSNYFSYKDSFLEMMCKCTGLRLLSTRVSEEAFDDIDKIPCVHVLSATEFTSLEPVKVILQSTSLEQAETIAVASEEAQTESEHAQWQENVKALGEYINMELEARRAAREQDAKSPSSDTTLQMATSPTSPVLRPPPPRTSRPQLSTYGLDDYTLKECTTSMSRDELEQKFSRMEDEIKDLKQRLDAITGSRAV